MLSKRDQRTQPCTLCSLKSVTDNCKSYLPYIKKNRINVLRRRRIFVSLELLGSIEICVEKKQGKEVFRRIML